MRLVLAHAPGFVFETSFGRRNLKLFSRLALGKVLRREEYRKVLADNLVGRISFNTLGARIPGGHTAVWVEHEDRVVLDTFDHQSQAFLTLAKCLFGLLAFGEVARNLQKAPHHSLFGAKGGDYNVGPEM